MKPCSADGQKWCEAKHSHATHGSVRVWRDSDRLHFEIRDNGRGLNVAGIKQGGGLLNIRDRLDVLGGTANVMSEPGKGASVAGWIPLKT